MTAAEQGGRRSRILVVEPYYGGSHRQFLDGLRSHLPAEWLFLTLPARKWKMRMQLAAPWVVAELAKLPVEKRWFDTLLVSTFVDCAVLRALLSTLPGWNPRTLICLYFHENQFAYPSRSADPGLFQFTAVNFNSALAADRLAFNSEFNRRTFLDGVASLLNKATDIALPDLCARLAAKSTLLYPGIELAAIETPKRRPGAVIVWNHRWEADKNPQQFFSVLRRLKARGVRFQLLLLGQSFQRRPSCFAGVDDEFADELLHCGFVANRQHYLRLLGMGTVVVSTALHEFYGIAVIEAVRAGCRPLLPNRLSYPELFPHQYLYKEGELAARLEDHCRAPRALSRERALALTERFSWQSLAGGYRRWLGLSAG